MGVGVGRVLLSGGVPPSSVLPRAKPGLGGLGVSRRWPWSRPGLGLLRERVGSLIWPSPGRGEMTVGGVSIAPVRRSVPGHAQPVQQLPPRVPVELHPGARGTAALRFECSFPWNCGADRARDSLLPAGPPGERPRRAAASPACPCVRAFLLPRKSWAAARNRSIPRTADGRCQRVEQHPAVSGADGSSAAQPLIPATGPPECLCGTSGSARPDRPR